MDLTGFGTARTTNFQSLTSFDAATDTTTLTMIDTSQVADAAPILLSGNYSNPADLSATSDGHGGIDVSGINGPAQPVTSVNPTYLTLDGSSTQGPVPTLRSATDQTMV